jgi:hypothetical protein
MRPILALAILVLRVSSASPEPEYFSLLPGSFHLGGGESFASLVEIESSRSRGDREQMAAPQAQATAAATPAATAVPMPAAANTSADSASAQLPKANEANADQPVTLDTLCQALLTAAQENNLPVAFFANLIWQESGLRDDAVSSKGAMGIAQFMPETAEENDLKNPFDPLQALSASARLLHELRDQFGNLGFVAAAYNAGSKRVSEWLQGGHMLPRETRGYVLDITGRTVEQWKTTPPDDGALQFVRRMPCLDLPAFAELNQVQLQQAALVREQARQAQAEKPQPPKPAEKAEAKVRSRRERLAEREHPHILLRRERVRTAEPERHSAKHEVKERTGHLLRERHGKA